MPKRYCSWAAGCWQNASSSGDRSPSDSGRLYRAVHARADLGCPARQGAWRGPARGPPHSLWQTQAANHRRTRHLPFEANAAHLFFQLVSRRYERGSMLITSNRSIGEWGTVFGDAVVATAILDRLLHHSHVITIRSDSYRLREKR